MTVEKDEEAVVEIEIMIEIKTEIEIEDIEAEAKIEKRGNKTEIIPFKKSLTFCLKFVFCCCQMLC